MSGRTGVPVLFTAALLFCALLPDHAQAQRGGDWEMSLTPATVTFPMAGVGEFLSGFVTHSGVNVTITWAGPPGQQKRHSWRLLIRAGSQVMGPSGKPESDLEWRLSGSGTWTPLSDGDALAVSGSEPTTITLRLRARLDWRRDRPGLYQLPLIYSLETVQ